VTDHGLIFSFSEMERELRSFVSISSGFLSTESVHRILPQLIIDLETIRLSRSFSKISWRISSENPLKTKPCEGAYEIDVAGKHNLVAEISSVWEIQPIRLKKGSSQTPKYFGLVGNASTLVKFTETIDSSSSIELGSYRMEVGTQNSPGVHFHVQVLGQSENAPFPKSLSVPRFPSYLTTPMSAIEFTLGEIFQVDWRREAQRDGGDHKIWHGIQTERFRNIFDWQIAALSGGGEFPVSLLKHSKPPTTLFVRS